MTTDLDARKEICWAYGLSEELADRLLGNTEDELRLDAEKLAGSIKNWRETTPITPAHLNDLSQNEVNARWSEVQNFLAAGPGERGPLPKMLTADVLRSMTQQEINERWDEVQQVLSRGR